jgi:hypothetical protein
MNRAISVVLLALAPALSFAQEKPAETKPAATAETRLPLADEVLDKYVEALGGKAAFEKLSSRVMKGDFELTTMGVTSAAEIYAKAPNKWLLTINVPGFGLVQQGYDGASGWAQDPQTGLRDLRGGELESVKRSAEFNQPLKLKALFPKLEVKEKSKVGEREVYVLEATPAQGSPEKLYFDTQTHLLVRADVEVEGPQGKTAFEISFDDYKEVDGIKLAHTVSRSSPVISFVIKVEEIKHNVPIEDSKFQKPAPEKPPEKPPAEEKKTP